MGLSTEKTENPVEPNFSLFHPKNQPSLSDFQGKISVAEDSLKKGIFARTKPERIRALHHGLLTVSMLCFKASENKQRKNTKLNKHPQT